MSEKDSLAIFSSGAQLLAEANTIQKAKELKDLALTAGEWAKRKKMGEEAIVQCRSYALEAERKLGELLLATSRAKPPSGKGQKKHDRRLRADTDGAPTLAELGLGKKESARAQLLAQLPLELFEQLRLGKKVRFEVEIEFKQQEREKRWAQELARRVINGEGGRKKVLYVSADRQTLMLVIGPNLAGSNSFRWMKAYQASAPYQEAVNRAAALGKEAAALVRQAERLLAQADQVRSDASETALKAFVAEYGVPISHTNAYELPNPKSGVPSGEQEAIDYLIEEINSRRMKPTGYGFLKNHQLDGRLNDVLHVWARYTTTPPSEPEPTMEAWHDGVIRFSPTPREVIREIKRGRWKPSKSAVDVTHTP